MLPVSVLSTSVQPCYLASCWQLASRLSYSALPAAATDTSNGFSREMPRSYLPSGSASRSPSSIINRHGLHLSIARGFAAEAIPVKPAQTSEVPESSIDHTERKLGQAGAKETYGSGYVAPHPGIAEATLPAHLKESYMEHPTYDADYLVSIHPTHKPPVDLADRVGLTAVRIMRKTFDIVTGYGPKMTEAKWLQRMIFLETVAGVPGMVAGMLRHLHSLRLMRRDKGWIHCLLEEAENERLHLLTFMELRKPGPVFRAFVLLAQGIMFNAYFLAYLLWPRVCHAFVGYLEEEAVRTYTHALEDIDAGKVWKNTPAPPIAINYWKLKPTATMRDVILVVRADEACHSHVNATLKALKPTDPNPFALGKSQMP